MGISVASVSNSNGPNLQSAPKGRIVGLDTIRFLAAMCVAVDHLRPPVLFEAVSHTERFFSGILYAWWFCGPASVILFFIISGFCIHYQYANGKRLDLVPYSLRRYLRILIPVAVCLPLSSFLGHKLSLLNESILWSLVAELIYYTLYPAFLYLRRRGLTWKSLIGVAYLGAIGVAWTDPSASNYPSYGNGLNWLLGLPCWLLGCELAERKFRSEEDLKAPWLWRTAVGISMIACLLLRHHSPVGFPHTLNYFALIAFGWLRTEIPYLMSHPPKRALEWAGGWSYSLYLVHLPIGGFLKRIPNFPRPEAGLIPGILFYAAVLSLAYLFYLCVEKPAHLLAKTLAGRIARKESPQKRDWDESSQREERKKSA